MHFIVDYVQKSKCLGIIFSKRPFAESTGGFQVWLRRQRNGIRPCKVDDSIEYRLTFVTVYCLIAILNMLLHVFSISFVICASDLSEAIDVSITLPIDQLHKSES